MSRKDVRYVNVVPHVKVKKEIISDEDEDNEQCRICSKTFASTMALRNHAKMEHMDVFATGDSSLWTEPKVVKDNTSKTSKYQQNERLIKMKTEEIISSMEPTSIMSLASDDVSYIIIKAEPSAMSKIERKRKSTAPKPEKVFVRKEREKEIQPITGPFECLQPSNLVADGTCHQIFFSCCEYSTHFRDEHTRRRKGLRCQVCEKPLVGAGEEPTAPYPCEVCGMGFDTNKALSEHMAIDHIKLKPFECSICHKRFTQQGGVQQHMRMHTGDRPFPCTFCPKAFTQKSGLDQHLRIHTKVKPYRCVICCKTFCQSVHLKQHMRTHTNVSPFQCGICQKRFKQSSHLNYHLKNHNTATMTEEQKEEYKKLISLIARDSETTKKPVHQCPFCRKRFVRRSHMNYHIVNHNTDVMNDEQKEEYKRLVLKMEEEQEDIEDGEIIHPDAQNIEVQKVYCMPDNGIQYVEININEDGEQIETDEVQEVEMEDEVEMDESEILAENSEEHLLLEEQNIQAGEQTECYILTEEGNDDWSVKLAQ